MILLYLAALAGTGQVESPRAFIQRIYAGYSRKDYNPLDRLDHIFAPPLAAAIREDERAKGEVGYLDGDPLCDCQDYLKLTARIRVLKLPDHNRTSARVHVSLGVDQPRDLRLELVRTAAGWRVADVVSKDGKSLLSGLRRSNRTHQ